MPEEQMTTDDWLYKLSCKSCTEIKQVRLAGIDKGNIFTVIMVIGGLALLAIMGQNDKTSK